MSNECLKSEIKAHGYSLPVVKSKASFVAKLNFMLASQNSNYSKLRERGESPPMLGSDEACKQIPIRKLAVVDKHSAIVSTPKYPLATREDVLSKLGEQVVGDSSEPCAELFLVSDDSFVEPPEDAPLHSPWLDKQCSEAPPAADPGRNSELSPTQPIRGFLGRGFLADSPPKPEEFSQPTKMRALASVCICAGCQEAKLDTVGRGPKRCIKAAFGREAV